MGSILNGIAAARRHPRLRRHVPDLLRLHAPLGQAGRADAAAGDLRLDPRLDRARRGRTDPPADRAPGRAAGDPRPGRRTPGRRQRDGRLLADDARAHRPPGRADPDPPERPDVPARRGRLHRHRNVHRGGYVLLDVDGGAPDVVLVGTGSEVQLAVAAREHACRAEGIRARVVSMPCREWFDAQDASYRETVIPPTVKARVSRRGRHRPGLARRRRRPRPDRLARALRRVRRLRAHLPRVRHHRRSRRRGGRGQHPAWRTG